MSTLNINIQDEGQVSAPLVDTAVAGEDVFRGSLCYLNQDGKYWLADASSEDTCTTELRIAQADIAADAEGPFIEQGLFTTLGLTVGERYYVSTTPGQFTTTKYSSPNIVRYIGTASSATELQFNPMDVKEDTVFFSQLNSTLAIPNEWEENAEGLTVADLQGLTLTQVIELLFLPTVQASISVNPSVSISGQETGAFEVGTIVVHDFDLDLNQGTILNGDQTVAGSVIGELSEIQVDQPTGGTAYENLSASGNSENIITAGYVIEQGTNTWTIQVTNVAGTTTYTDNKGGTATVASIESAKADTNRDDVNFSVSGAYRRFHYVGIENGSPTTTVPIRALTNALLSTTSTGTWTVAIGAGASNAEFSFYIPQGKTISVIDQGNLNLDITGDFTTTAVIVNDPNGAAVNYTKYTRFAGALGYTNPTTFEITVT